MPLSQITGYDPDSRQSLLLGASSFKEEPNWRYSRRIWQPCENDHRPASLWEQCRMCRWSSARVPWNRQPTSLLTQLVFVPRQLNHPTPQHRTLCCPHNWNKTLKQKTAKTSVKRFSCSRHAVLLKLFGVLFHSVCDGWNYTIPSIRLDTEFVLLFCFSYFNCVGTIISLLLHAVTPQFIFRHSKATY